MTLCFKPLIVEMPNLCKNPPSPLLPTAIDSMYSNNWKEAVIGGTSSVSFPSASQLDDDIT